MKLKSLLNVFKAQNNQTLVIYDYSEMKTYSTGQITSEEASRLMELKVKNFSFEDNKLKIIVK